MALQTSTHFARRKSLAAAIREVILAPAHSEHSLAIWLNPDPAAKASILNCVFQTSVVRFDQFGSGMKPFTEKDF